MNPAVTPPFDPRWAIQVEALSHRLNAFSALRGIDLHIPPGEIHGLLGPLGSGKSSLIKLLAGMGTIHWGRAWMAGEPVEPQNAALRRKLGYMPGYFGAYDDLLVREYLDFFARACDAEPHAAGRRIDTLLAMAGLTAQAGERIQSLGEEDRRRLAVIKTAVHAPPVLLFDSPGISLTAAARARLRELIRAVQQLDGATTLIGSNILTDVTGLCSRLGLIFGGQLVCEGRFAEIAGHLTELRRLELKVPESAQPATIAVLAAHPALSRVKAREGVVVATLQPTHPDPAAVIAELTRQGAVIDAFRECQIELAQVVESALRP